MFERDYNSIICFIKLCHFIYITRTNYVIKITKKIIFELKKMTQYKIN